MDKLNIKTILQKVLVGRAKKNAHYTMRSLARDLKIAPSTLSEVLSGKKNFSLKKTNELLEKLNLPQWQADYLKDQKLRKSTDKENSHIVMPELLNDERISSLTNWLDVAILEAINLKSFRPNTAWLSTYLKISIEETDLSVNRLIKAGLLRIDQDGNYEDLTSFFSTSDGIPSEAIRKFHVNILEKAKEKILFEGVNERVAKTVVLSLDEQDVDEVKNIINEAVAKVMEIASRGEGKKDHVVCFSSQLFYLLKGRLDD